MSQNLYVYAQLGREGLGNLLVPWARAEVFSKQHNAPMLAPQWTQPKVGPLLRGERDKRYYIGLFDNSGYVRGIRKRWILATARRTVTEKQGVMTEVPEGTRLVVFGRGPVGNLQGLGGYQAYVRARLEAILSPRIRAMLEANHETCEVAVHLRRGDRPPLKFREAFAGAWHPGLPDEWFINCIQSVREAAGRTVRMRVFSDARPGQIDRIMGLPEIELAPPNPSIVDMFLMSRCKVLITTGTSTFSEWSAFLGGPLAVYYPGLLEHLKPDWPGGSIETDLSGGLSAPGAAAVRAALASDGR